MLNLSELIARFLSYVRDRQATRTHDYYRVWLERFAKHVGEMPVADVRRHHLLTWAKSWYEFQTVQRLFRWAFVEMEIIAANPFANVKRPPLGNRQRVLSRKETVSLLRGSDATFRPFLFAMIETAARPQEVRVMRWEDLRDGGGVADPQAALALAGGWIQLADFKARRRRSNPNVVRVLFLTDRLRRLLIRLWRNAKCKTGEIFQNSVALPWNRNSLRCRMRRLRVRVGLGEDGNGEKAVLYTLRHSTLTSLAAAGMGEHALMHVAGHTSTRTTQRYIHLQREATQRAFDESMLKARKERWR